MGSSIANLLPLICHAVEIGLQYKEKRAVQVPLLPPLSLLAVLPLSKDSGLKMALPSVGPASKQEMLDSWDVKLLHAQIEKYWDRVLATPPDCSDCKVKVTDLTKRLQECQDREKKLLLDIDDYKRKVTTLLADLEKKPTSTVEYRTIYVPFMEYKLIYVPYAVTNTVIMWKTKIKEVVKWKTKIKWKTEWKTKIKWKTEWKTKLVPYFVQQQWAYWRGC